MRQLSAKARDLLDRARQKPRRFSRFLRRGTSDSDSALLELATLGEPAAIPDVLSLVIDSAGSVFPGAAEVCAALLEHLPLTDTPQLDEKLRERSLWWGGWWNLSPCDLNVFRAEESWTGVLLCLATCHPSGYVREEAVRRLAKRREPGATRFLLLRKNDWVREVRTAADEALDEVCTPATAAELVAALPLVYHLSSYTRADHSPFVSRVEALLRRPECRGALILGTRSDDRYVRRACYRLGLSMGEPGALQLAEEGLADADAIVRLDCSRQLAAQERPSVRLLERIQKDPFPRVRQVGLSARLRAFPQEAARAYRQHLLDRSAAIRIEAQSGFKAEGQSPRSHYLRCVEENLGGHLDVAVIGLGETGHPEDAQVVRPLLDHEVPRVRTAALRTLARLLKKNLSRELGTALADDSPQVSREAKKLILAGVSVVDADKLWQLVFASPRLHVAMNALAACQAIGRWPRLCLYLRTTVDAPRAAVSERAIALVERWLFRSNRAALVPSESDLDEARRWFQRARSELPDRVRAELEFLLRTIGAS